MTLKKLLLTLSLFPTFTCLANCGPNCGPDCGVPPPCYTDCYNDCGAGFEIYGDWLYWRARRCELDYAAPSDFTTAFGDIYDVTPQYDSGFRVGVAANWCEKLFELRYTHYRTKESSEVRGDAGTIVATRFNQNFMDVLGITDVALASGRWDLKYDVVDVLAGYELGCSPCFHSAVSGGFTFARINQDLDITYATDDGDAASFLEETIHMKAYGVNLGFGASYDFWNCLSAFGDFSYNALLGNFKRGYTIDNSLGGAITPAADLSDACWRMVSVFNLAFGLKYNYQFCGGCLSNLGLALGYEFHHWVNMADFLDITEFDVVPDRHIDSLGFDGLFLRLAVGF